MKSFLRSFFEGFLEAAPYPLVFFVFLHTYMAIAAPTITITVLNVLAACTNGLVLYYHQTRGNI